jgi:hypothetical protein
MFDPDLLWSPDDVWRRIEAGDDSAFDRLTKFQKSVLMDERVADTKQRAFNSTPVPAWIQAMSRQDWKRQRGWWAGLPAHDNNPLGRGEEDGQIAAKRTQCNRLTQHARSLGAKKNSDAARLIRIRLMVDHGESIRALGNRGVSTLAKELSPAFGLAASTLRAHITGVRKDLMTSR